MAIALDTSTDGGTAAASALNFSHTCTGSNLALFVTVVSGNGNVITGVTYNTVAMTQLKVSVAIPNTNVFVYIYGLLAPATGANTVAISASASVTLVGQAASYTGVLQSGLPDSSNTNSFNNLSSGSNFTTTTTSVLDNCWGILGVWKTGSAANAVSGCTRRQAGTGLGTFDTNGVKTPAGAFNMVTNQVDGTQSWGSVIVSFAPSVASTIAVVPQRMLMGIGS